MLQIRIFLDSRNWKRKHFAWVLPFTVKHNLNHSTTWTINDLLYSLWASDFSNFWMLINSVSDLWFQEIPDPLSLVLLIFCHTEEGAHTQRRLCWAPGKGEAINNIWKSIIEACSSWLTALRPLGKVLFNPFLAGCLGDSWHSQTIYSDTSLASEST